MAQKALAKGVTEVVHGKENAKAVINLTETLFSTDPSKFATDEIKEFAAYLPTVKKGTTLIDALTASALAESKTKAREFIKQGAISVNGTKVTDEEAVIKQTALIKKGKNKFAVAC